MICFYFLLACIAAAGVVHGLAWLLDKDDLPID